MKKLYLGRRLNGWYELGKTKASWNKKDGFPASGLCTYVFGGSSLSKFISFSLRPGQCIRIRHALIPWNKERKKS